MTEHKSGERYHYLLGIQSCANANSGACIVRFTKDGRELDYVAISEERLIRRKHPYSFPLHSLRYCMDAYGLKRLDEIDLLITDFVRVQRWLRPGPTYNYTEFDYLQAKFDLPPEKMVLISHHMAHAASAFYPSGFDEAAILVVDGSGSGLETNSFLQADNGKIWYLDSYKARGVGALYAAVTNWILGLGDGGGDGGEGKTMGLAPYGESFAPVLDFQSRFDGVKTDYSAFMRRMPYYDALNSVANKIMFDATAFEEIFVFPASSDAGIPFGLAIWGYYNAKELGDFARRKLVYRNAYSGRDYGQAEIDAVLDTYGIAASRTTPRAVAELIAEGNVVGWFQGASEYGPRALGHRLILADSRRSEMKDIVNTRVKHRETYRPFAPAVLLKDCADYFDIEGESPYMLLVAEVKQPDVVPSISHVDNTARVQTVTRADNGVFYDLIAAFKEITGVPVILNTSFNDAGEPIVETPEDALICFLSTDMDYLVLGDRLVVADRQDRTVVERLRADREARIAEAEQDAIEQFFPGYDEAERDRLTEAGNQQALWHITRLWREQLEAKVADWAANDRRVLLVGTPDHTAFLVDQIEALAQVNFVGLVPFEGRCDEAASTCAAVPPPFEILPWSALERDDYDEIMVSSHEYMYEIVDALKAAGITKPVYQIYDNTTRSPMQLLSTERASLPVGADHESRTLAKGGVPRIVWPGPKGS